MKLKFTYFLFALGTLSIALSYGSSGGRATAANSGNTGAPGDNAETCITCHGTSAAIQVTLGFDLLDGAGEPVLEEYTPGVTYTIKTTINVADGSPAAFGFQMTALNAALDVDGPALAGYSDPSSNATIATTTAGRTYLEHDGPSTGGNEFTALWTAPEVGTGAVSFYACGNGVNNTGSTGGDNAACFKVQFNEAVDTRTNTLEAISDLNIYPNPVSDNLMLEVEAVEHQSGNWTLNGLSGQVILSNALELNAGNNLINIPVQHLSNGIYFLKIQTEEGFITKRIIKQ